MASKDLSAEEVKELLRPVTDQEVIAELYAFGSMLLERQKEWNSQVESKAGIVVGWSTGISAFLLTQFNPVNRLVGVFILLTTLSSIVAIVCAFCAIKSRVNWVIPSDKDWFKDNCLTSSTDLQIYHVRSIHDIKANQWELGNLKAKWLLRSETALTIAAVLIALGTTVKLFSILCP